jgi:hypothetical protein
VSRLATCRYHCRSCGAHFTSLRAFDSHRVGPWADRRCELPDELIEIEGGACRISNPELSLNAVTLYEDSEAERLREYLAGREGVQRNVRVAA